MKKFLTMGALALTLAAICVAPAPAWLNWKFGVGLNLGWQSGGNNTLWGLFRNGQPPGPDCGMGGMGGGCMPPGGGYGAAPFQPGSFNNAAQNGPADAAPIRGAIGQSYQTNQQQNPWSNYNNTNTVGYRYPYYPYSSNYNYGYSR